MFYAMHRIREGVSFIYIPGLAQALTILGPVIGYVIGGYQLTVYVDFDSGVEYVFKTPLEK